jgi:hypothetical protein
MHLTKPQVLFVVAGEVLAIAVALGAGYLIGRV